MPHSPDTQLMQDLRDTSEHRFSVQIKLMLAAVTLVPVIMVQFMVPLSFLITTILLFIIPGHLLVAAMQ
jgi:Na+-translocating ferredoxin:NAD+ oxidoreductase RnfD subunit